jgi:hypothetical protein
MSTIRSATLADLDAVSRYLADALHGDGGPARYRRYLACSWVVQRPDFGMLIEDAGKIRGFIGTIYADRRDGAEVRRFCNITSVAVDESHRKLTLKLFGALLANKVITYTCFSPSPQIATILDFFKFEHRPGDRVVVGPITGLRLRQLAAAPRVHIYTGADALDAELDEDHRTIARDHRAYRCGQLLLVDRDRRCFVVTVRRGHGVRAFADVLYASDPEMLLEHLPWIHAPLFRAHGTVLTGIDRCWVSRVPRTSFIYTKLRPLYARIAKAATQERLSIDRIDMLYSEFVPMYGSK